MINHTLAMKTQKFTIEKKFALIKTYRKLEKRISTPVQPIVQNLHDNFSYGKNNIDTLNKIKVSTMAAPVKWIKQFCEKKGHLELFYILSCEQARFDFQIQVNSQDYQIILSTLQILKNIYGLKNSIEFAKISDKSIQTIIYLIQKDENIINTILEIMILLTIQKDDEDYRLDMSKKNVKYFGELNHSGKNAWNIISSSIEFNTRIAKSLNSLIKILLLIFSKTPSLFNEWYQDVIKSGLLTSMKYVDYQQQFKKTLDNIKEQKKMHEYGINMKIISSLSVDQTKDKHHLEEIMNQLNNDNFLNTEDPFFDLKQLEVLKEIGSGSFGTVYLAKCRNSSGKYAVKESNSKVDEETPYSDETLSIFREINLMGSFNHPTILKFIGYSPTNFKDEYYPTIIMEYCVNKTLDDIIELENKGLSPDGWDETKKLINIYGIAAGMKYLHQQSIVHRDLKSQNILMDEFLCPKIADFGLSKITKVSENSSSLNLQSMPKFVGTPNYMAPEIIAGEQCSTKGDVYAFAFIVYKIVTGLRPFDGYSFTKLLIDVSKGIRPNLSENVPQCFKNLIIKCWDQSPSNRPSFESIVDELRNDHSFITDSVDESVYYDFVDFVDNYQSTFDISEKHILFDDFIKGKHGEANLKKVSIENLQKVSET